MAEFPGLELFTASNGADALRVLQEHPVDLAITDISMPVMDGMELVAAMVSQGIKTAVAVATAFGSRALPRGAHGHGVVAVLDKPIDFAFVLRLCRERLDAHHRRPPTGVTLAGLLYLLTIDGRSCTIRTFCEEGTGQISIDNGRVVHCTRADDSGSSALRWLLSRTDMEVELERRPRAVPTTAPTVAQVETNPRNSDWTLEVTPPTLPQTNTDQRRDLNRLEEEQTMANIDQSITQAMNIPGCMAAALVDYESGMCLGSREQGFPIEVAAAGNTEVLRAKMRVMSELGIDGGISDILITLDSQYHLIVPMRKGSLFLYIAIDRKQGNLAMARHKLNAIQENVSV